MSKTPLLFKLLKKENTKKEELKKLYNVPISWEYIDLAVLQLHFK